MLEVIPETNCPYCKAKVGAAAAPGDKRSPRENDYTLCMSCGFFLVFTKEANGLGLRKPDTFEVTELANSREAQNLHALWICHQIKHHGATLQ